MDNIRCWGYSGKKDIFYVFKDFIDDKGICLKIYYYMVVKEI